jgi:hypothetical protein
MSAAPNPPTQEEGTRPPTLPIDNPPSFIETIWASAPGSSFAPASPRNPAYAAPGRFPYLRLAASAGACGGCGQLAGFHALTTHPPLRCLTWASVTCGAGGSAA